MKHRVGVLGSGAIAEVYVQAILRTGLAEVAAVCSRNPAKVARFVARTGLSGDTRQTTHYSDLLRDPDINIIVIGTPNDLHPAQVEAAAEAGKHVLVEKPVAVSVPGLARCLNAVRKAKVLMSVGFVLRWAEQFRAVKGLVGSHKIGKPFYIETGFDNSYSTEFLAREKPWMLDPLQNGDIVSTAGIHAVDLMAWWANPESEEAAVPVEVTAMAGGFRDDLPYRDFSVVLVRFDNGCIGKVHTHFSAVGPYDIPFRLYGTHGTLRGGDATSRVGVDAGANTELWSNHHPEQLDWISLPKEPFNRSKTLQLFEKHLSCFLERLEAGGPAPISLESTAGVHEICLAAVESVRTQRTVRLPLVTS